MSRLSKMLIYNGFELWPLRVHPIHRKDNEDIISGQTVEDFLAKPLKSAVFVDATNIKIRTDSDNTDPLVRLRGIHIVPPFKNTWVDTGDIILVDDVQKNPRKTGVLIQSNPYSDNKGGKPVYLHLFCDVNGKVCGPFYSLAVVIDKSGMVLDASYGAPSMGKKVFHDCSGAGKALAWNLINRIVTIMLFMNCESSKLYPDHMTDKVQKKAISRLGSKIKSYTLNINKPNISYEKVDAYGSKKHLPYHTVMGHLRRYSPERPMFGKVGGYAKPVLIPDHARGNKKYGEIHKDYKFTQKEKD